MGFTWQNTWPAGEKLSAWKPLVYVTRAKHIKDFKKAFPEREKTDLVDSQFIAEYLRFGRLSHPFQAKCRYHLAGNLKLDSISSPQSKSRLNNSLRVKILFSKTRLLFEGRMRLFSLGIIPLCYDQNLRVSPVLYVRLSSLKRMSWYFSPKRLFIVRNRTSLFSRVWLTLTWVKR